MADTRISQQDMIITINTRKFIVWYMFLWHYRSPDTYRYTQELKYCVNFGGTCILKLNLSICKIPSKSRVVFCRVSLLKLTNYRIKLCKKVVHIAISIFTLTLWKKILQHRYNFNISVTLLQKMYQQFHWLWLQCIAAMYIIYCIAAVFAGLDRY